MLTKDQGVPNPKLPNQEVRQQEGEPPECLKASGGYFKLWAMAKIFWVSFLRYPVCDTLTCYLGSFSTVCLGFPGGSDSKESACNAGDLGSSPESGRSPEEGNGHLLHYSSLENSMNRGARWATVHAVTEESDMNERLSLSDPPPRLLLCCKIFFSA